MSVAIRRADLKDARTVAEFALRLFTQHRDYDPDRFADLSNIEGAERYYASRMRPDTAAVLVAEVDGKVVGFAFVEYESLNYAELLQNAAWLHDLYVDENTRGTGAGRALIEASRDAAKSLGADKLVLSVAAKNSYARGLFAKSGFRETMIEMTLTLN